MNKQKSEGEFQGSRLASTDFSVSRELSLQIYRLPVAGRAAV